MNPWLLLLVQQSKAILNLESFSGKTRFSSSTLILDSGMCSQIVSTGRMSHFRGIIERNQGNKFVKLFVVGCIERNIVGNKKLQDRFVDEFLSDSSACRFGARISGIETSYVAGSICLFTSWDSYLSHCFKWVFVPEIVLCLLRRGCTWTLEQCLQWNLGSPVFRSTHSQFSSQYWEWTSTSNGHKNPLCSAG